MTTTTKSFTATFWTKETQEVEAETLLDAFHSIYGLNWDRYEEDAESQSIFVWSLDGDWVCTIQSTTSLTKEI